MWEKLIEFDRELFLWLNNAGVEALDPFMLLVSGKFTWIPLYLIILILMTRVMDWRAFGFAIMFIVLCVFATDQGSVQLFKELIMRPRPCHDEGLQDLVRLVKDHCGGRYGFISSHASNVFGLAIFATLALRNRFPWMAPILIIWATLVGYSRIYLGVHFPGDVVVGALYGAFCGALFFRLFDNIIAPKWVRD